MNFSLKVENGNKLGTLSLRGNDKYGYCYFLMSNNVIEQAERCETFFLYKFRYNPYGMTYEERDFLDSDEYFMWSLRGLQELGAFHYRSNPKNNDPTYLICLANPDFSDFIWIEDGFFIFRERKILVQATI